MKIYILRHAIAVPKGSPGYPNDDRPLTEEGAGKMKKAAKGIARMVPGFDRILTSPLKRAIDTAKIVAAALTCENKVEICAELLPGKKVQDVISRVDKIPKTQRILVVGHESNLGLLVSFLLGTNTPRIVFKKGTLCLIECPDVPSEKSGKIIWLLPPKVLRALYK